MAGSDVRVKSCRRLRLGPLTIDPDKRRLLHDDGREIFLEPRVIQVLAVLVEADGEILSRDDLVDQVWGGRAIGDEAVFRAVSRLRQTTEGIAAGVFRIETIPKAGYRLILEAPAAVAQPAPSPPLPLPLAAPVSRRALALAAATVGVASLGLAAAGRIRQWAADPERFAVLPFDADDGTPAAMAEGLTRELVGEAERLEGLQSIGAASSFRLPAERQSAAGAAEALGATMVLVGRMQATGDRISVSAQLRSAPDGRLLWSETVGGPPSELFRLRNMLLTRVAATAGATGRPGPWRDVDPEALRLYFEAQAARHRAPANRGVDIEARLDRAVARDPGFAEAWSALGTARLYNTYRSWVIAPRGTVFDRDRLTAAVVAANRASALRPDLAEPFDTTASAMGYLGAWQESHRAALAAMARGGAPSAVLLRLGLRREAVSVARAFVRRDPLNGGAQFMLGQSLRLVGEYEAAAAAGWQAVRLLPITDSYFDHLVQLIDAGRMADARRLLDSEPKFVAAALVQYAPMTRDWFRYLMGETSPPDPDAILQRIDQGDGFHEMAAIMFARMGAMRHAAMMLDRMGAYEIPVIHMIFGEDCAPLRQLPAFGRLMQRIGLAAFWREGDHWPDFRFTLDERVGRGASPARGPSLRQDGVWG